MKKNKKNIRNEKLYYVNYFILLFFKQPITLHLLPYRKCVARIKKKRHRYTIIFKYELKIKS